MKRIYRFIPAVLPFLIAMTAYGGGWATVTLRDVPEYFVAGKAAKLTFVVRQHGFSPLDGLAVSVRATAPGAPEVQGTLAPMHSAVKGEYAVLLTLPQAGDWTIAIGSGWGATSKLLPVKAIRAGSPAPSPLTEVSRGERLFVSKACITCHVNKEVLASNFASIGPALTGRTFAAEYLQTFLADPASAGKDMPNQELTKNEIGSLIAFINRKR